MMESTAGRSGKGDFATMASTYVDMIAKLQAQTLESIKTLQSIQLSTLTTVREMVTTLPTMTQAQPADGVPSIAQVTELNTKFATELLDQQKAYANQLAELFAPVKVGTN